MQSGDRRYVVSTWVRSFADNAPWSKRLALASHWGVVDRVLDEGSRVVILGNDSGAVHAWACGSGAMLHYAYVPPELRGNGMARRAISALLGDYPEHIDCSHPWPRQSRRFRWQPYVLLTCKEAA